MLKKMLLLLFYYPERPSLGPILTVTKFFCVWSPDRSISKTILYFTFLFFNILYTICLYIKLIIEFDYNYFVQFVQYSAFQLGVFKTFSYVMRDGDWKALMKLILQLELESTEIKRSVQASIVLKYRNYSQFLTYSFWIAGTHMVFFLMLFYWTYYIIIPDLRGMENVKFRCFFCALLPFEENSYYGRYISAALQTEFAVSASVYTWTWDAMILSAMVFLMGQLNSLYERCSQALDSSDEKTSLQNIIKCHNHYLTIVKCYRIFKSIVSPVMFVHFLHVTINCAVCIINIAQNENLSGSMSVIDVLFGLNFQLLLFCWIANEVIVQGDRISYGIFESKWPAASARVRRAALMLGMGMRQRMVFTAGPFYEISLTTFVSILRTSYSFYALLAQKK